VVSIGYRRSCIDATQLQLAADLDVRRLRLAVRRLWLARCRRQSVVLAHRIQDKLQGLSHYFVSPT
jgi:hypothetical protein